MTRQDAEAFIRGVSGCIYAPIEHAYEDARRRVALVGCEETAEKLEAAWTTLGGQEDEDGPGDLPAAGGGAALE